MEATPLEKSVDEGAVQQITTAQDELPETKKRRKKREKIIETEVIYKKSRVSMFPIIFGMLCGFCAVALVVVIYVLQTYFFTDSRNSHVLIVGDYVNQTYTEQFHEELEASGYTISVEWVSSSEYLANTIISQKPEKNARRTLHRGSPTCELTLVVSSGENLLTLPDYTGVEYRQAQLELRRQKVNYVIEKVHSTVVESGMIISTYPKAGTVMGSDTTITLYVSMGANTKFVTVPSLVGLTASQLDAKLKSLELRMGKVSYTYSDVYAPGVVIEQSLVSGVTVQAGITSIDVVVSLGPKIDIPAQTTPPTTTVTPQETVQPTETTPPDETPSPEETSEQ